MNFDDLVDDEDKYGSDLGVAKSVAAGTARGATFGLSDQALVKSGLVNPETLKGLQETNPIASGVGEIAGTIAPAFLGDEAGLLNLPKTLTKLGGVVEGAAAAKGVGKVASKALGYGLEGAGYGAGQSVSENAFGDHDLVSEKTLANIGLSAAFAGGIGGLVGKFGPALDKSSVEDKFLAKKIENASPPGSAEAVISKTDMPAEDKLSFIKNFKKQKPEADSLRKEFSENGLPEVLGMMSDNKMVQKYASAISQLPTTAGEAVRKDVDQGFDKVNSILKDSFGVNDNSELIDREAGGAKVKDQIRQRFDELYDPLKKMYAEREALGNGIEIPEDKAYDVYEDIAKQGKSFRNKTNPGRKVFEKAADDFLTEASGGSLSNLDAYSKQLSAQARQAAIAGDHDVSHAFNQVRDTIDKFIDTHISSELGDAGKELRSKYGKFKSIISDFAKTSGFGKKANTEIGLNEALDKIPNEKFVDKIFDPKNAQGLRDIKENFPEMFDTLVSQKKSQMYQDANTAKNFNPGDLLSDINTDKKVSKGVRDLLFSPKQLEQMKTAEKWIKNLPDKVGPSGTPEGLEYLAMAKNPIKSLIGHSVNEAGSAAGKKLIESLVKPEEEAQLKTLLNLDKAQDKTNKSMMNKIGDILSSSARPVTSKIVSKLVSSNFEDETDQIRSEASNANAMMDKFANVGSMDVHAPRVSQSMKMAYARGVSFLNSKIPPQQTDFFGKKLPASEAEIGKFNRYYRIVQDPVLALDQVKIGNVMPETLETLNSVYPKLYMDMKQNLVTEMMKQKTLPYQTRQSISMFMGEPVDKSLNPQSILANQSILAGAPRPNEPQQGQMKTRAKGLDKMDRSGRFAADYGAMSDKV